MVKKNANIEGQIIAKAWKDPQFKATLLKNPRATLEEMGLEFSPNVQVKILEDKPNTCTFVLPPLNSESQELSEKEIAQIAAGNGDRCTRDFSTCWAC